MQWPLDCLPPLLLLSVAFLQVGSSVPSKLRHIPLTSAVIMSKLLLGKLEVFFNSMRSTLFLM